MSKADWIAKCGVLVPELLKQYPLHVVWVICDKERDLGVVVLVWLKDRFYLGSSYCSPRDEFNESVGTYYALKRMKAIPHSVIHHPPSLRPYIELQLDTLNMLQGLM